MKKIAIFLFAVALWTSCKKQDTLSEQKSIPTPTKKTFSAGDGGWDVLGYGYNVLGIYANSSATTFQIINVAQLKADYPDKIETDLSKTQTADLNIGSDALSYLKTIAPNISIGTDTSAKFKATIKAAFKDSTAFSSQYVYSSYNLIIQQKRLKINSTIDLLKNYLNANFVNDVQNQSAAYVVSHYGTHVLTDAILGAKLDMIYRSATTSTDRKSASSSGLDIGIKNIFNISTGLNTTSAQSSKNYSSTLHYATHGGDPSKALIGDISLNGTTPATINITSWQNSSTVQNAELIDIGSTGLVEISQLIADPVKASALHNYIIQYLAANQASLLPAPVYEFYALNIDKHAFNLNPSLNASSPNYTAYGETFDAYTFQYASSVPVYQYYHPQSQDHLLTTDPSAALSWVQRGYNQDGILFYAYTTQVAGTIPVYAFYKQNSPDHYYSTNRNVVAGQSYWAYQGICFYAYPKAIN
ncbi:MAC/perforin domain-containing protein [Mucilaginibacter polytrichastri]|nr:MAC/perforin domain-containing protein [Mucilaginibacter polytrichastri]